jgi:hypothetical protein
VILAVDVEVDQEATGPHEGAALDGDHQRAVDIGKIEEVRGLKALTS